MSEYNREETMIQRCLKFITVPKTNYRQQIAIKKWDKESISKTTIGKKNYHEIFASKGCTGDWAFQRADGGLIIFE